MRGRPKRGLGAAMVRAAAALFVALSITLSMANAAWAGSWVIPPGQETLLAAMLGKGETLPGACVWSGANIEAATVAATYDCASGKVAVTLAHPSVARDSSVKTDDFAISGPPDSAALLAAVAERVRARQGTWRWEWVTDDHETGEAKGDGADAASAGARGEASQSSEPPPSGIVPTIAWAVVALWCVAFAAQAARKRAPIEREDRLDLAAFFAFFLAALALRLAVPSGPLDFAEPERTQALWSPGAPLKAMFESIPLCMSAAARLGFSTRTLLEGTGPLFGALGASMTYALARVSGLRPASSIVAASVVLVWPAHVRYAATSGFSIPAATLWTAALAVAMTRRFSVIWRVPLLTALVVLGVYARPEMRLVALALVPLLFTKAAPAKERAIAAGALAVALAPYAIAHGATASADASSGAHAAAFARWVLTDVSVGMPWWFLLAALGWFLGRGAAPTRLSLALATLALAASYALFASEDNPLWGQWRLYVAIVPFVAVSAASLLDRFVEAPRAALLVAAATAASGLLYRDVMTRPIDLQVEYAFVRDSARAIAEDHDDLIVLTQKPAERGAVHVEAVALSAIAAALGGASWPSDGLVRPPDDPDRKGPRLWTERVLLQGKDGALEWDRAALYVGLNAPDGALRSVRDRFDLAPIASIERSVAPATPAVNNACAVSARGLEGASLDDCAVSLGWFRLTPKRR